MKKLFHFLTIILFVYNTTAQNVGIGTNTPEDKLTVSTPVNNYGITHTDGTVKLSSYIGTGTIPARLGTASSHGFGFFVNGGTPVLNISTLGNIGIGTQNPANNLEIGVAPGFSGNHLAMGNGIQGMSFFQSTDASIWYTNTNFSLMPYGGNGNLGIGSVTPHNSAKLDVSSTTQGFLPPRLIKNERNLIASPAEGLIIYNRTTKRLNYYDGIGWSNFDGSPADELKIGQYYQGGIIAYILQPADPGYIVGAVHGLIAATSDIGIAEWGCMGTEITGAEGSAIGTGRQNTLDIIAGCATAGIAARLCDDFVSSGYIDWYLPSIDELNMLYLNKSVIGNFVIDNFGSSYYWSSTEDLPDFSEGWNFNSGTVASGGKSLPFNVRPIRKF